MKTINFIGNHLRNNNRALNRDVHNTRNHLYHFNSFLYLNNEWHLNYLFDWNLNRAWNNFNYFHFHRNRNRVVHSHFHNFLSFNKNWFLNFMIQIFWLLFDNRNFNFHFHRSFLNQWMILRLNLDVLFNN